ncbi:MAG: class II aldolase [bacterium]|nr:class II aldolase [bacterium]
MNSKGQSPRAELLAVARQLNAGGLNQGTSGNLSIRSGGNLLITPSAVPYDEMGEGDLVEMTLTGDVLSGGKPSSEWRFHCDILAGRDDVSAVLHAHPAFSTALACLHREIPAFHYMVAAAGGNSIRCAPYATFGTPELSTAAAAALAERRACLLAQHGIITLGATPRGALDLAIEVEALAAQYLRVLQIGEPRLLDDVEMNRVLAAFKDYRPGEQGECHEPHR